jgi:murein DD-endopeptidase MepM/ murein hydrolase activator NlpD
MKFRHLLLTSALLLSACTASHPQGAGWPSRDTIQAGEEVTVENGENVYAIAVKNGVSMRDIIVLNDLKSPYTIRPGQRLTLPLKYGMAPKVPAAAPRGAIESAPVSPLGSPVESAPLPPPSGAAVSSGPLTPRTQAPVAAPVETTVRPVALQPQKPAEVETTVKESANDEADKPDFAMQPPLQGPVILSYGAGNDGVNIGAPKGSAVVSSAGGIVVYAGNEMKGFGNLILIRHEDGWVTAYAHLDRMLVGKDTIVAAGDQIGTVGTSGGVSAPQLHFELRHNSKPVDPKPAIKG